MKVLLCFFTFFLGVTLSLAGQGGVKINLAGTQTAAGYTQALLKDLLERQGYQVLFSYRGEVPTTRLEVMLETGELSVFILGETPRRNARLLPIRVAMTGGLMGHRILFIPPGTQDLYKEVRTLGDFRRTGLTAGMGAAWADVGIWKANGLKVYEKEGDWKNLFLMVAVQRPGIDYLPRGVQEILVEYPQQPQLAVEQTLVFRYPKDSILYVTPLDPELHTLLAGVLQKAESSGRIREFASQYYRGIYQPPISLQNRRLIDLELPRP